MFEELITSRCKIRKFKPSDADGLFEVLSDAQVMKFVEQPFTHAQTCDFVLEYGLCENPKIFALIVDKSKFTNIESHCPKNDDARQENSHAPCSPHLTQSTCVAGEPANEQLIGHVIFHPFHDENLEKEYGKDGIYELGFVIAKPYWNMGIATEVATSLVGYARQAGFSALVIECATQNVASIHIAKRLGFCEVATNDGLKTFVLSLR